MELSSALAAILPGAAERVVDGGTETVPLASLEVGDVALVRPGARVPAGNKTDHIAMHKGSALRKLAR